MDIIFTSNKVWLSKRWLAVHYLTTNQTIKIMRKNQLILSLVCVLMLGVMPGVKAQIISTYAGCGIGDDSLATHAEFNSPVAFCYDHAGNAYIADAGHACVRMVNAAGVITTFAGNGVPGYAGDGGPATAAEMGSIYSIAADKAGNVYIVDNQFNCIRKVNTAGIISTIAGNGMAGYSGDGGPATAALLNSPIDIVLDTAGNVIFTDWLNAVVRKINTAGIISTIVGNGTVTGAGNHGPATASSIGDPFRVTMDNKGNLYVAEVQFQCICKVDTAGIITIIADTTGTYAIGTDGDGGSALTATMTSPCGMTTDTSGHLYFSDISNDRIRVIDLNTGIISAYAGTGVAGYSGDGGAAVAAEISIPEGLGSDSVGNVYICDASNNVVRVVDKTGTINTWGGMAGIFGEGYAAGNAQLDGPVNVATDAAGNVYVSDLINARIRKIDAFTGIITTVAGRGVTGPDDSYSGDGGPATAATIYGSYGVAVDTAGNIYIADAGNSRIRKVNTAGIITTIAGTGVFGYSGDGGPAVNAKLNYPTGVAVDNKGNIYIADYYNSRIRKINSSGVISTLAGSTFAGFTGDGGAANAARLDTPIDVATDGIGNVYISDFKNNCIRKVDTAGIINTLTMHSYATAGFSGDGGPSTAAQINGPAALKADAHGNVFFVDQGNQRVRMINTAGVISTLAGNGIAGFSGDGGMATSAMMNYPYAVAVDNNGNLFISDADNNRIRKVTIGYLNLGVPQPTLGDVQVYPNPAHEQVTVVTTTAFTGTEKIAMYDVTGREVYSAPLLLNRQTINMNNLASGVYMLHITGKDGENKVVKITKE